MSNLAGVLIVAAGLGLFAASIFGAAAGYGTGGLIAAVAAAFLLIDIDGGDT